MTKSSIFAVLMAGAIALSAGSAAAAGDAKKGKRVFNKCKACHTLVAGKNKLGPSLNGVIGRKAGTVSNFRYSKAMKEAGAEGLVWNETTLAEFLKKPKKMVPGTSMPFAGLRREKDRENLIAYLKQAAK